MNDASLKSRFDEDGYVVIRGYLAVDEVRSLQSELERYIDYVVPTLADGDAFYDDRTRPETLKQLNRLHLDSFFSEYVSHPRWTLLAETLLGERTRSHGVEWFNKPPGTHHVTPPHQDNYYFCLTPPQVLTMWVALDVVDEENGCLRYLRESHRHGLRPHHRTSTLGFSQGISDYGERDLATEIPIPAQPGDVLIHHGNTVHRADANASTIRHRRSLGMVFQGLSCVRDEQAFQRYLASSKQQHQSMGLKT